jgi:hypothetical protein
VSGAPLPAEIGQISLTNAAREVHRESVPGDNAVTN